MRYKALRRSETLFKKVLMKTRTVALTRAAAPLLSARETPGSIACAGSASEMTALADAPGAALEALSSLSLSRPSAPPGLATAPVLAWDALNYLREFLDEELMRRDPFSATRALEARTAQFAAAARRGGFRLIAVVDADTRSDEASGKWRGRREDELKSERRSIVLGADVLLTDALRENGVEVVRPLGADADDVLAALAAFGAGGAAGGGVMSRDGDMYRYMPRLAVYDGWRLEARPDGDALVPIAAAVGRAVSAASRSARDAQPELAAAALRELGDAVRASSAIRDKYAASAKGGCVRRGCSSSSDKRRGNLHALARPLRAAVYARLGEQAPVREIMPQWLSGDVAWTDEAVLPDAALDALLDDVKVAAAWLDARDGHDDDGAPWPPGEASWRAAERAFNRRILAAELCAAAADPADPRGGSLLALMRAFAEYGAASPSGEQGSMKREVTFAGGFDTGPPAVTVTCSDCRGSFGITAGELRFFKDKGYEPPKRCKPCRERRKVAGGAPGRYR
jgi:hypothetical protein